MTRENELGHSFLSMITSLVIKKHNLNEKRGLFRAVYANFAGCSGQLCLIFSCKFPLIAIVRL